jgi:FKBP-type peptidyl-prolyl cis-trans isomerase
MRYIVAPLIMACLLMTNPNAEAQNLESDEEKWSYAIGRQMGESVKNAGVELDADALFRGLDEGMEGIESALTVEQLNAAMMNFQKLAQAKQAEMAKEQAAVATKEGEEFLAKNGAREGVITTASGLQYEVIRKGTGRTPAANDTFIAHYTGTLVDGTQFDSSQERGPLELPVNQVIPGWTEALQLMKTGSKWKLYIPNELAYGMQSRPPHITPGAMLIFEMELLGIK